MEPRIAEGQDVDKLTGELVLLINSGWKLGEDRVGVRKTYHLKTYTKVLVRILPLVAILTNDLARISIIALEWEASRKTTILK